MNPEDQQALINNTAELTEAAMSDDPGALLAKIRELREKREARTASADRNPNQAEVKA